MPSAILALTLLGISGLLIDAHRRRWRGVQADASVSESNLRYARSEYRRRMQASSTIGVVGCMIAVWQIVPRHPVWMTLYVALLLMATISILLLAVLDMWASTQRFHRLRTAQRILQAQLARELKQQKANPGAADHQARREEEKSTTTNL